MPSARRSSQVAKAPAAASTSSAAAATSVPTSAEAGLSTSAKQQDMQKEEASTDAHLELLTEHFGYNPKSFIDALVYLSNEHLYSIATEFENVVLDLLKHVDGGELEAEQGMHAILTLMENSLDHTLDTFELYCFRSVFGIRSRQAKYMTLDHHRGLDLRTRQPGASSSSKGQNKSARKSVAGTPTAASASQRSYQLGETEDSLKRQIAAARATQHKLVLAKNATQESLNRMLDLAERFSAILYADSNDVSACGSHVKSTMSVLTETLGQHARKLKADTIPLLRALQELRSTDPLGEPLYSGGVRAGDKEVGDADADDDAVVATDVRAWEGSRENYLNWEADRIITESKRSGAATGAAASASVASGGASRANNDAQVAAQDATLAADDDSKTPKRKRSAAQPSSSKRKTPATATRSRG